MNIALCYHKKLDTINHERFHGISKIILIKPANYTTNSIPITKCASPIITE